MLSVRLSGYEDGAPCTRTLAAPAPDAQWTLHAADAVAVTLPGLNRDLLLQQTPRGAACTSLGVGGVLWEAALVLAAAVDALAPTGRLTGAIFVELGAGAAGLPSLPSLAAAAAAAAAVATDRGGGVVGALEASAALNGLASESPCPTPGDGRHSTGPTRRGRRSWKCASPEYVQKMTFDSYLFKTVVRGTPVEDVKLLVQTVGSLLRGNALRQGAKSVSFDSAHAT
jgi:hypothetical protein